MRKQVFILFSRTCGCTGGGCVAGAGGGGVAGGPRVQPGLPALPQPGRWALLQRSHAMVNLPVLSQVTFETSGLAEVSRWNPSSPSPGQMFRHALHNLRSLDWTLCGSYNVSEQGEASTASQGLRCAEPNVMTSQAGVPLGSRRLHVANTGPVKSQKLPRPVQARACPSPLCCTRSNAVRGVDVHGKAPLRTAFAVARTCTSQV